MNETSRNRNKILSELRKKAQEEKWSCVIADEGGHIVFYDEATGIGPLYRAYKEKVMAPNGFLYDKVIGRAAAFFVCETKVRTVFTPLLSRTAQGLLKHLEVEYDQLSDYILNRDGTDMCPMEKLSMEAQGTKDFVDRLETFWTRMRRGN